MGKQLKKYDTKKLSFYGHKVENVLRAFMETKPETPESHKLLKNKKIDKNALSSA